MRYQEGSSVPVIVLLSNYTQMHKYLLQNVMALSFPCKRMLQRRKLK